MSSLRDDNRRLTQTVSDLRVDRHAQDRKMRDLEQQVDLDPEHRSDELGQCRVEVSA